MSTRHSIIRFDHIEYSFWLIFDRAGGVRMSRGEPSISRGERAMSCTAKLPKSLFKTPELKASIAIGEQIPDTFQIDVAAASEALKQAVGVDVDLRISGCSND